MSIQFIYPQFLWLALLIPTTIALGLYGERWRGNKRILSAIVIRTILLTLLIFSLAGIQLQRPSNTLTTIFVMDFSDSISAEQQDRGKSYIRTSIQAMKSPDKAAIVIFGEDALVERLASDQPFLPELASIPHTSRTDIASAIQLGMALFPNEGARRLILLSDGQENLRYAIEQAEIAAALGIEISFFDLSGQNPEAEAYIHELSAPSTVRQGQSFDISATLFSTTVQSATLQFFMENTLIESRDVALQPGLQNKFQLRVQGESQNVASGFKRFRLQLIPQLDTRLQNNRADAFTVVHGPPRILLVEGASAEGENLLRALEASSMEVNLVAPHQMPNTLQELASYEVIILNNTPASALPSGVLDLIPLYVRDLGNGLLMTGGGDSFGAGGYLRTPIEAVLPVDMDVRDREMQANLALVLAVDKSGSMSRCHCDDPDLNQTYTRAESGQPKVDIAKEAIMRSAGALSQNDFLGVVAFDSSARWVLPIELLTDQFTLEQAIGRFQAEGQTNLSAGVEAAYQAIQDIDARRKHIILLTDGWVHTGDLTDLATRMSDQGITLSIIAAGGGSAEYLEALALSGGGRYYPATDILNVPDIFLKETVTSVGQYIIEEAFYPLPSIPGPAFIGIDVTQLPPLLGYNGTTVKNTARQDLLTPHGDPLLATWQYGLGRSAAWTSDLKNQWASEWLKWEDFPRFASQLVGWLLPAPSAEGLEATATLIDDTVNIRLKAIDQQGRARSFLRAEATIVDPTLETTTKELEQTGPGLYEANIDAAQPGVYLIRLGANDDTRSLGQLTLGVVSPYSPEYKTSGGDRSLLMQLANLTGGEEIVETAQVWADRNLPSYDISQEIWRPLLIIATLLFPIDVALRRLNIGRRDLMTIGNRISQWISGRINRPKSNETASPPILGQLFNARQRARQRQLKRTEQPIIQSEVDPTSSKPSSSDETGTDSSSIEGPPSSQVSKTEDTLTRLQSAKRRAQSDSQNKSKPKT